MAKSPGSRRRGARRGEPEANDTRAAPRCRKKKKKKNSIRFLSLQQSPLLLLLLLHLRMRHRKQGAVRLRHKDERAARTAIARRGHHRRRRGRGVAHRGALLQHIQDAARDVPRRGRAPRGGVKRPSRVGPPRSARRIVAPQLAVARGRVAGEGGAIWDEGPTTPPLLLLIRLLLPLRLRLAPTAAAAAAASAAASAATATATDAAGTAAATAIGLPLRQRGRTRPDRHRHHRHGQLHAAVQHRQRRQRWCRRHCPRPAAAHDRGRTCRARRHHRTGRPCWSRRSWRERRRRWRRR